jgi:uncharacterized integral membrane protein
VWLLKAAIFFVLFAFALNNQAPVHVHLFFGAYWQAPLVLVLLIALTLGVVLGVLVMLPIWLRVRRRWLQASSNTPAQPPSPTSAPRHGS